MVHVVSVVSQIMYNYSETFACCRLCFIYLKATSGEEVCSKKVEVDYAGLLSDTRSILGYCTFLYGTLLLEKVRKKSVVAR